MKIRLLFASLGRTAYLPNFIRNTYLLEIRVFFKMLVENWPRIVRPCISTLEYDYDEFLEFSYNRRSVLRVFYGLLRPAKYEFEFVCFFKVVSFQNRRLQVRQIV